MDDDEEAKRELLGSLRQPLPQVVPYPAEKEGPPDVAQGVVHEYAFALIIKKDGMVVGSYDLVSNARGWRDHVAEYTDTILAMLILILSVENGELGGVFINKNPSSDPHAYQAIVDALARRLTSTPKEKDDDKIIKYGTSPNQFLNLVHQRDINLAKQALLNKKSKGKDDDDDGSGIKKKRRKDTKKGKKEKEEEDANKAIDDMLLGPDAEEDDEDEDQEIEDLFNPNLSSSGVIQKPILDWFSHLMWHNRMPHKGAKSDIISVIGKDKMIIDNNPLFNNQSGQEEDNGADESAELSKLFAVALGNNSDMGLPKATMNVSVIRDADDPTIVTGYLVRFFQYDPTWNPGKTIHDLIEQCKARDLNSQNQFYKDPWPNYADFQGTNFPVHKMTWQTWMGICKRYDYKGPQNHADHIKMNAMTERADDYGSSYHPCKIFTINKALDRLREAGGNVGNIEDYSNPENRLASYPEHVRQRTVTYLPNQVFWDGPNVGLVDQYFPYAATHDPEVARLYKDAMVVSKADVLRVTPKFSGYKTFNVLIHMEAEAQEDKQIAEGLFASITDPYRLYKAGRETKEVVNYRKFIKESRRKRMERFVAVCNMEASVDFLAISAAMKATLRFLQGHCSKYGHITYEVELVDPEMSFFGNGIARQLLQIEKILKIVRTMTAFKCEGLFSVARGVFYTELRFNYILYGEKGEGKSVSGPKYTKKMCVKGTVIKISRKTAASEQTDVGMFDEIQVEEEMDQAYVDPKVAERQVEKVNIKKDAMTTGEVNTRVYKEIVVAGKGKFRGFRDVNTAHNYVTMATTNAADVSDNAIASRYYKDTITHSNIPTNELKFKINSDDKREVMQNFQVFQSLTYWIEKAIAAGVISEPNMDLWDRVSDRMLSYLNETGVTDMGRNARIKEITSNMARVMVFKKAYILGYCIRGAPFFGRPFDPETHLPELQRYFYADTELVLFVWTMLSNEVVPDKYAKILDAAQKVVRSTNKTWDIDQSTYDVFCNDIKGIIKWRTKPNPAWDKSDGTLNRRLLDLNYMSIEGSLDSVSQQISTHTEYSWKDVRGALIRMSGVSLPPNINGRNGYGYMPEDDLKKYHRVKVVPKTVLKRDTLESTIRDYALTIKDDMIRDVVRHIDGVQNVDEICSTPKACSEYFSKRYDMGAVDIVFLYLTRDKWKTHEDGLKTTLAEMEGWTYNDAVMRNVFNSIDNLTIYPDSDLVQVSRENLTYKMMTIVIHGLKEGYFYQAGTNQTTSRVKTRRLSTDQVFGGYPSESDIPMLLGNDANDANDPGNNVLPIVDLTDKKCISFCPLFIGLFDKNLILEAFRFAVMCGTTRPGKYITGWPTAQDMSKVDTLSWTQEYINSSVREFNQDADPDAENRENGIPFKLRGYVDDEANKFLRSRSTLKKNIELIDDLDNWSATIQHVQCGFSFDDPVRTPQYVMEQYKKAEGHIGSSDYPKSLIRVQEQHQKKNWAPNGVRKKRFKL